jgi:MFS family permease
MNQVTGTESAYRWVIVGAGALMGCVAFGAMFSLAVYLAPMSAATGWSREAISSAMTIGFLTLGVAGFAWGSLSDRIGARPVALVGAVLLGATQLLAARAQSVDSFRFVYGIGCGLSAGCFMAPMVATVMRWFATQRSLAISLASAGVAVAPMTISPFARWLISAYDWHTAMTVIGLAAWILLIPAALLVRPPPIVAAGSAAAREEARGPTVSRAFRSPQFLVLGATFFACCAAHSGPIFHTVSYAIGCGIAPMAAVSIYSLEGLAGLGGRLVLGLAADRFGVKPVLITGLLVQALAIQAYLLAAHLIDFYAFALVFGMAYGGVMPLYAVLAREYFGQRILGTVFGAAQLLSSLGMALGPVAGGWVYDSFHAYTWLYTGSSAMALGAAAIALAFPPQPSRMREAIA